MSRDAEHTPARQVRTITNTAGEHEREACSRRWNAIEAFAVYTVILTILWPFAYYLGELRGLAAVQPVAVAGLVLGAAYLLLVSPFVHRDTPESWGLGNPAALGRLLRSGPPARRLLLAAIVVLLFLGLNYANYARWPDVAGFFGLDELSPAVRGYNEDFPGLFLVLAVGVVLSTIIVTCAIRYDNFVPAFLVALKVSLPLLAMIFLGAYVQSVYNGTQPFAGFDWRDYLLDVGGYVFWGFTQQLLFTAYLGNRFRKAFPPSTAPDDVVPPERRWSTALLFGTGISVALSLFGFFSIRSVYGAAEVPGITLLWFLVFSLPICLAYGYTFTRGRKRLLVATLAASCFGLIHIDSYGLVAATFLLGIILIYVSMEDRHRNLVALGFIHGLLGSTFGWLFSSGESGALEVDYSVGPWNVDNQTLWVLASPLACIAFYLYMMYWGLRHLRAAGHD